MARRTSTGDPNGFTAVVVVFVGSGGLLDLPASSSLGCTGMAFKTGLEGSGISVASFSASGEGEDFVSDFATAMACTELYGSCAASSVAPLGVIGYTASVSTARAARGNSDAGRSRLSEARISP